MKESITCVNFLQLFQDSTHGDNIVSSERLGENPQKSGLNEDSITSLNNCPQPETTVTYFEEDSTSLNKGSNTSLSKPGPVEDVLSPNECVSKVSFRGVNGYQVIGTLFSCLTKNQIFPRDVFTNWSTLKVDSVTTCACVRVPLHTHTLTACY